uniref:Chitin-binding type-2 domain-containing protein n=1 Tax=Stomoxys calcitrans TaxID=35570 RepID=A0A1I8Q9Q6_STOCA
MSFFAFTTSIMGEHFEECSSAPVNTYVGVPNECYAYIYCSDTEEDTFKEKCPEGTYFDAVIVECVVDELNTCPENMEVEANESEENIDSHKETVDRPVKESSTSITQTTPLATSITATTALTPTQNFINSRPVCDRHNDAYYPHPGRCEYYYKCMSGYLSIFRCSFFYAWDYQKEICLPKDMVRCFGSATVRKYL